MDQSVEQSHVSRRGLLTGAGALAGGAMFAVAAPALPASAAVRAGTKEDTAVSPDAPIDAPAPIGSALVTGIGYVYKEYFDFVPTDYSSRTAKAGDDGLFFEYSAAALRAPLDLPVGATVYDMEIYATNSSGSSQSVYLYLWRPGSVFETIATVTVPSGPNSVQTARTTVPASANGPYPPGSKLLVVVLTTGSTFGVHGARIGLRTSASQTTLLPAAVRIYDSRTSTPIKAGQTQTIGMSKEVPAGAVGAILSISVLNTNKSGSLHIGSPGTSLAAVAIQWARTGDRLTAQTTSPLNRLAQLAVQSFAGSGNTDFVLDLIGYLA